MPDVDTLEMRQSKQMIRISFFAVMLLSLLSQAVAQPLATSTEKLSIIDKIVAKVDNHIILKSELDMGIIQAKQGGEKFRSKMECKVLEGLVLSKMMLAKAEIDTIKIDDKVVDDQLERRMQYMIATIGSKEKLEAYYKKTVDQFKLELRKQVKEQLLAQKVQKEITDGIKVTPAEVRRFFAAIPKDSIPYFSKEVEVGQIVIKPKESRKTKQEARKRAEELRNRLLKGEDFEDLAKEYSEDPGSAKVGGNLGFWGKGDMTPNYENTALRLKAMEISEVVESPFGFHIIQLLERKGAKYNSRHILIRPKFSTDDKAEAIEKLDSLKRMILRDSISFLQAAKKYTEDQATKESGGLFVDQASGSTKIALENLDPVVYFIIDTMQVGTMTAPIPFRTEDNKEAYRIVYFKSKTAPHYANLKEDYQKIQAACLLQKKQKAVQTWFEKTRTEVFVNIEDEYKGCTLFKDGF